MGIYVCAHQLNSEGTYVHAPMEPFQDNALIGIYSDEHPYFKLTAAINELFVAAGVPVKDYFNGERYGVIFTPGEVATVYANLFTKNQDHTNANQDEFLHFLGVCMTHQYSVSLG